MPWRETTNAFGGRSVTIAPQADIRDLPDEFAQHLRDDYREAHARPEAFFQSLADRCQIDGLRHVYLAIAASGGCALQIHRAEPAAGTLQSDVLFRIRTRRLFDFGFRLPDLDNPQDRMCDELAELYDSIDGTVEGDVWESGGIEPRDSVGLDLRASGLPEPTIVSDEGTIESFYRSDTGDYLFAGGGKAYWYLHENGNAVEAGDLRGVINRYFSSLIDGANWLDAPYVTS